MSGIATAIVGGSVVGGLLMSDASKSAANTQANATNSAAGLQYQEYNQTRDDQAPWRAAGATAVGQLSNLTQPGGQLGPDSHFSYNDLYADPSYQFRLNQGMQAVQRSAAAKGGLLSGGALKGLSDYAQNSASQEYNNAYGRWNNDNTNTFNRLSSVAGLGQTANQATAQNGQAATGNITNLVTQGANAQAAGTVGSANDISGSLNNGINTWMQYNMLSKLAKP